MGSFRAASYSIFALSLLNISFCALPLDGYVFVRPNVRYSAYHVGSRSGPLHETTTCSLYESSSSPILADDSQPTCTTDLIFNEENQGFPIVPLSNPLTEWKFQEIVLSSDAPRNSNDDDSSQESQAQASNEHTANEKVEEEVEADTTEDGSSYSSSSNREAIKRAALVSRGLGSARRGTPKSSMTNRREKSTTSVGDRRVGSATRERQIAGKSSRMMDAIRKAARGVAKDSENESNKKHQEDQSNNKKESSPSSSFNLIQQSSIHVAIGFAIGDLLKRSFTRNSDHKSITTLSPGLFSEDMENESTSLSSPLTHSSDGFIVRVSTPPDDVDIARLRLSVFADLAQQQKFCARSCEVIAARRKRGAVCIVATKNHYKDMGHVTNLPIYGTAECSFHEFHGTRLGRRRLPSSILYVTEFAVHPGARRRGIGSLILRAIDSLAMRLNVETLYLHVDVCNATAISLYRKSGYCNVDENEPIFQEFTKSLNLHPGATKGRTHYLLFKDIGKATWLQSNDDTVAAKPFQGKLGFEIPA